MNVLEVQGLTKRYPAFTLNGVSFDVPQGAVMGFIGRNGAGKSTTLKSILVWYTRTRVRSGYSAWTTRRMSALSGVSWAWCWRY